MLNTHLPFFNRTSTQRGLFGLSIVLIGLIIAGIIRSQQSARRENKLRSDLYRNRLRTIQAYLNPHFLFNTLTSIQDHILQQDARAGNDMIVRLSRVFRKVFDVGRYDEHNIPMTRLSEEIALIKDIVYLNNKQLSVPVRFELYIDPALENTDPLIPPMLIQPFVENAFKHAFGENDSDKSVLVHFTKTKETLSITGTMEWDMPTESIAENSAMGTQLTRERMTILNALNSGSIDVQATDPHGTLVTITIKLMT
jgi:LytS/YehU family sensor histidine kinase